MSAIINDIETANVVVLVLGSLLSVIAVCLPRKL